VAVRAASSISGERDRQTFDSLLTTPLASDSILFAKWLGSVLSVRWAWLWLCLVWLVGALTGGLYGPAVPWLLLSWLVYAGFLSVLGLWFSMTCTTTLRATIATLLAAAALGVGHWYLWLLFCMPLQLGDNAMAWAVRFQMFGLTPPLALGWLAFRGDTIEGGIVGSSSDDPMGSFSCLIAGLGFWGVAGYLLYHGAARRFRIMTNRMLPAAGRPTGHEHQETRRPRRMLRVAIALAAVGVLLIIGWAAFHAAKAEHDLKAALDEITDSDPDWSLAAIEAGRKAIAADLNSAPLVLAVHGAMPRWNQWPTQEVVPQVDGVPSEVRLSPALRRSITNDLEEVEEALLLVGPLADLPEGRYTLAWSRNPIGMPVPHVDAQHAVRQLILYDLLLRAEQDDPDGAMTDCRRLLNLGRSLGDEPVRVSQSMRCEAAHQAVQAAQRVLAQGEPSERALAELQRAFGDEATHPGFEIIARSERAWMDRLMAMIQADEFSWQELRWFIGRAEPDQFGNFEALLYSMTPGSEKENRAALLRYYTALLEAARRPDAEQGSALERLEAQRKQLPLVARQLAWNAEVSERYRTCRFELRCATVALAAERFRRRHNHWPERLEDLAPDLLAKVPGDPFNGGPLHYKRVADGVVIYSAGANGQDDGGDVAASPRVEPASKHVGFRLWDVNRRRQEPPASVRGVTVPAPPR
jgi:hypothetical protein